jgi:protein ImuB
MLWLALFFPRLCLEVLTQGLAPQAITRLEKKAQVRMPSGHSLPGGPSVAVCSRLHVLQVNAQAQAQGVSPGVKRATALALVPDITLLERNAEKEAHTLQRLAQWLLQFSPQVSLHNSGQLRCAVLVDITGSLTLFGGRDTLLTQICSGLYELGFEAQIACAPTPGAAWLLAQCQHGSCVESTTQLTARLGAVPIDLLDSSAKQLDTLHGLGIHNIKDLAGLPRPGLARRFGPALLTELDRALGRMPDPRPYIQAPREFALKLELLAQIENAQALTFAGKRMLLELTAWLTALHAGVRQFTFYAHHDDGPPTPIIIELAEASRESARLNLLLRERLEKIQLPQAAHTLELICNEVVSLLNKNDELFPNAQQAQESLARLVERLQGKLGKNTVQQLFLAQDHRPETAYKIVPVNNLDHLTSPTTARAQSKRGPALEAQQVAQQAAQMTLSAGAHYLPRPLWLMPKPLPISEKNHRPWYHSHLQLLAGPERIEGGWWDNDLVQRDYFIGSDEEGVLYWLYRTRATIDAQTVGTPAQWYLQGVFG